jgi:hypothetical protein
MEHQHKYQSTGLIPSTEDAQHLLRMPNKVVARPFAWLVQASGHTPKIHLFESAIQVGNEVLEGVTVRASYRGPKIIQKGMAKITTPEKFECALFFGIHRVAAIDTNPGQRHHNSTGTGLPFYNQTISTDSHRHIWTGAYGYAEPIDPPLLDVLQLIHTFAAECNLIFQGNLVHPLRGEQGELL